MVIENVQVCHCVCNTVQHGATQHLVTWFNTVQVNKSWKKVGAEIGEAERIGPGKPNKFRSTKKEKSKKAN